MRWLNGRYRLDRPVGDGGTSVVRRARDTVLRCACAPGAAHGKGLVHRDVRPASPMRSAAGPEAVDSGAAGRHRTDSRGVVLGIPAYMSPEQSVGALPTPAADPPAVAERRAGR